MTKFVITSPIYESVKSCYVSSMNETIRAYPDAPYLKVDHLYIHVSRYTGVSWVKQMYPHYDGILWIDSDMEWQPEDVEKVTADKDKAVGAIYMSRKTDSLCGVEKNSVTGEMDYIGFGFIYTPLSYFWDNLMPWFQVPWIGPKEGFLGEDVFFCRQASAVGNKIYGIKDHTVAHCYEPGPRKLPKLMDEIKKKMSWYEYA